VTPKSFLKTPLRNFLVPFGVFVVFIFFAVSVLVGWYGLSTKVPTHIATTDTLPVAVLLSQQTPTIVKNIKTDFGAVCDGTTDDANAFVAFNTWAKQWQASTTGGLIELDLPAGSTCVLGPNGTTPYAAARWTVGVKKLLMKGNGATFKGETFLGGFGIVGDSKHHAYTQSVSAGSNFVVLKTPSDTARFTVGNWVVLTGFDLQGFWNGAGYGYPPNAEYFDYVQVTAIDPTSGKITFAQPFKYDYKDTWPLYDSGGRFGGPTGGPPTLYALDPSWDTEVEYNGVTFNFTGGQTYANGRDVVYKDVILTGGSIIPTQNLNWSAINVDMSASSMEVDKLITNLTFQNVKIRSFDFQSSSVDNFKMDNSDVGKYMNGTPKKAVITNTHFASLGVGTLYYGHTDEFSCISCVIDNFTNYGFTVSTVGMSMSNGVITFPNTMGSQPWAIPGTHLFFGGAYTTEGSFKVIDVTQDATNTYVKTNLTGGWPLLPLHGTDPLKIIADPAPKFTCTNCTGGPTLVDLSQAPAGAPLYSYSKRTYTGNFGSQGATVRGKLVSMKINVTKPYTGKKTSLALQTMGQFGNFVVNSDGTLSRPDPHVNLKIAGERIITPATTTGQQVGDSFVANADPKLPWKTWDVWINGYSLFLPDLSADDPSTWPSITVEVTTDQGSGISSLIPQPNAPTPVITGTPVATPTIPVTPTTPTNPTTPTPTTPIVPTTPITPTTPTIPTTPPSLYIPRPSSIYVATSSSSQITLNWVPSPDARVVGYTIYRGDNKLGTTPGTSFTDTGLKSATTYQYGIVANDAGGNSSLQETILAATRIEALVATSTPAAPLYLFTRNLDIGSTGADVTALQQILADKGFFNQTPTGYFGAITSRAVAAFQRANNIEAVGAVGPKTRAFLNGKAMPAPVIPLFTIGERVRTISRVNVRVTPGGAFAVSQPAGISASIIGGPAYSGGYVWWQLHFSNGYFGWSVQDYLKSQ
jgi:peptidoglycan hydrolase-like protein with peptidoglycan-binding domain